MQYMLLIYDDEQQWQRLSDEERGAIIGEYFRFTDDLRQRGAYVAGDPLQPTATATTVRGEGGRTLISDGPFAETKEQLGGYYLIEAADLDEAIAWATKMPHMPDGGAVEVRPIMEFDAA